LRGKKGKDLKEKISSGISVIGVDSSNFEQSVDHEEIEGVHSNDPPPSKHVHSAERENRKKAT